VTSILANQEDRVFPPNFIIPGKKQTANNRSVDENFVQVSGFDERPVYFSDAFGSEEQPDEREVNRISARKRFREFIREFHEGTFSYPYR